MELKSALYEKNKGRKLGPSTCVLEVGCWNNKRTEIRNEGVFKDNKREPNSIGDNK